MPCIGIRPIYNHRWRLKQPNARGSPLPDSTGQTADSQAAAWQTRLQNSNIIAQRLTKVRQPSGLRNGPGWSVQLPHGQPLSWIGCDDIRPRLAICRWLARGGGLSEAPKHRSRRPDVGVASARPSLCRMACEGECHHWRRPRQSCFMGDTFSPNVRTFLRPTLASSGMRRLIQELWRSSSGQRIPLTLKACSSGALPPG